MHENSFRHLSEKQFCFNRNHFLICKYQALFYTDPLVCILKNKMLV